jgi:heme/copper-type cytochrome/quinol oxidase subunit 2
MQFATTFDTKGFLIFMVIAAGIVIALIGSLSKMRTKKAKVEEEPPPTVKKTSYVIALPIVAVLHIYVLTKGSIIDTIVSPPSIVFFVIEALCIARLLGKK